MHYNHAEADEWLSKVDKTHDMIKKIVSGEIDVADMERIEKAEKQQELIDEKVKEIK